MTLWWSGSKDTGMTIVGSSSRSVRTCPGGAHGCSCETCRNPQLDLRSVPPGDRQDAMLDALLRMRTGSVVVFLAPENPLTELYLVLDRAGEAFVVQSYEACPVGWRIAVARVGDD